MPEVPPLEGIGWRLTHAGTGLKPVPPSVAARVSLLGGRLAGWDGCGPIGGSYGRVGESLRLALSDAPGTGCARARARVADELRAGLVRAARFTVVPAREGVAATLVLTDADEREVLRFAPDDAGSLSDETWQLTSYTIEGEERPAVPDLAAVLTFASAGRTGPDRDGHGSLVGSSGCNGIVGTWDRAGVRLEVQGIETTAAPCASDVGAQEAAMLEVLSSSDLHVDLPPDRLILTDTGTGDRLELVTSTPLEESTWLLGSIPGLSAPGAATVTLRLDGGVVTGEGPCGPYQGAYETDGRVIRVGDLRGPAVEGCAGQRRQRKLLHALERAILVDRDQPELRLLDATGRLMASFDRPPGP